MSMQEAHSIFRDSFFSQSMRQLFNRLGTYDANNDNEAPVHKYLRLAGRL